MSTSARSINVTAYRAGNTYTLDEPEREAEPVMIVLRKGAKECRSGCGRTLIYPPDYIYGLTLEAALEQGWCTLAGTAESSARN